MISVSTAKALRTSGLAWDPASGDRFVIADRDMDQDVFVLSDMVVETQDHASGRVLGFNGTTEWALDSVDADQALWLPREPQLRELLGEAFLRLERHDDRWVVVTADTTGDQPAERTSSSGDPEEAYALALLSLRARRARSA